MNTEARRLMEKADHALAVADDLIKNRYPADAASKLYYAMFYAAQAVLKSSGIEVTKHSGVEAALGYHFAKTGKISPELHRMYIDSRRIREIADYDIQEEIAEQVALAFRTKAIIFVDAMRALLVEIEEK